jgi:hypothetical protein
MSSYVSDLKGCFYTMDHEVGPRGMTMHQKVNVLIFLYYMSKKGSFDQMKFKFDHFLVFIFSSPKRIQ